MLCNQLLTNSGPPMRNQDNHHPNPLNLLRNMCIETVTFDVDKATKNNKKITDLGPYNNGWVMIMGQHKLNNS